MINYTLPAPATLVGTFSAACGISLSYSNLSVCPTPPPSQEVLTLNGLKYDWVAANEASVKVRFALPVAFAIIMRNPSGRILTCRLQAAVSRSIAASVGLPEAAVTVISYANTGTGVAFTFAFVVSALCRTPAFVNLNVVSR
jgi:hypothetical protein